jgi:hypothetical protein
MHRALAGGFVINTEGDFMLQNLHEYVESGLASSDVPKSSTNSQNIVFHIRDL